MQIKAADDDSTVFATLAGLLTRSNLSAQARERIEQEVRNVRAGRNCEREAAYEIESYCHDNRNVMTMHDLRIEHAGWTAQIDHLVINRYLGIWVCESKSFSEGVEINDQGDWSAIYGGVPRGIRSPIQQNKKHLNVLRSVFDENIVLLPKRLGFFTIRPIFTGVVLISNRARILRPANPLPGLVADLATVIKAEQLMDTINRHVDARTSLTTFPATIARMVSRSTIENIARQLAALHAPGKRDYTAKFELATQAQEPIGRERPGSADAPQSAMPETCASCRTPVSAGIVSYCRDHQAVFGGRIFCYPCQQSVRTGRPTTPSS